MNTNRLSQALDELLRPRAPDGDLLARFVRHGDGAVFEALARRHGPMVWAVCHRVLRNAHDAEDAFQATFLLLVRKAASLRSPEMLGNWLYGVAYRTALEAKKARRKRRQKEAEARPQAQPPSEGGTDLREVLDKELVRLPDKYRVLLVLCDLEGRTRGEVARQLGLPEGTVAGRLSRGRAILAKRLARYGLPSGAVAALVSEGSAAPPELVEGMVKAACRLAGGAAISGGAVVLMQGVLKAMLLTKLKVVAVVLLVAGLLIGGLTAGILNYRSQAAEQEKPDPVKLQAAEPQPPEPQNDLQKLQGYWQNTGFSPEGPKVRIRLDQFQGKVTVIKENKLTPAGGDEAEAITFSLDEAKNPKTIDAHDRSKTSSLGIYSLEGDTLTICFAPASEPRPTEFKSKIGSYTLMVFRRMEPPKSVQLAELFKLYESQNDARADEQVMDKRFRVTGTLKSVQRVDNPVGGSHYYLVSLQEGRSSERDFLVLGQGDFKFGVGSRKQLAELDVGKKATIEGRCLGMAKGPPRALVFEDCNLLGADK